VEVGGVYAARASVRNNSEFPLGASVIGQLEIVWLDMWGAEIAKYSSRPFGRELSRVRWTRVAIAAAHPPAGAVKAEARVALYDRDRDGGSILVNSLTVTTGS
jgi:hypothetical protein